MLKRWTAFLLAAALAVSIAACRSGQEADETQTSQAPADAGWGEYTFSDASGAAVTLTERPERVAVLFSSFADIWLTAGGRVDITVGESVERGFVPEGTLLVDDGAGKTINRELLLSYAPDFVICSADLEEQVQTAAFLRQQGIPAAVFHVESFQEYLNMLKICTDITGDQGAYETYGTQVQAEIRDVLTSVPEAEKDGQKRILFVRAGSKYSATKAKTAREQFRMRDAQRAGHLQHRGERARCCWTWSESGGNPVGKPRLYLYFHYGR